MSKKLNEYCSITCDPDWFTSLAINTGYIGSPDTMGYLIPAPVVDAAVAVMVAAKGYVACNKHISELAHYEKLRDALAKYREVVKDV